MATMPVGVVVERRQSANRWIDAVWKPVSVFAGAAPVEGWRELCRGEDWVQYHAATVPLELHRTDAESYRHNLQGRSPSIYVVMVPCEGEFPWRVALATASPYEGEAYMTSGDVQVEPVPMPPEIAAWVGAFAEAHYRPEAFRKRQRDRSPALEQERFGKEPIFTRRRRAPSGGSQDG